MGLFTRRTEEKEIEENLEPPTDEKRIIGKIVFLNEDEGWGFIVSHSIKFSRIFFHWSALEQDTLHFTSLKKGMKVEFNPKWYDDNGWRAIRINVIESEKK